MEWYFSTFDYNMGLVQDLYYTWCWYLDGDAGHFAAICDTSYFGALPSHSDQTQPLARYKCVCLFFPDHETSENLLI